MKRHPFSYTIGPGPYKFVGMGQIHFSETFGARYIGPEMDSGGGTCAHCGQGIVYIYIVKTSEGKRFGVGSDCIMKISCNGGFENLTEFEACHRQAKRKQAQERRERQRKALMTECQEIVAENSDTLASIRAPVLGSPSGNLLQYARWYMSRPRTLNGYKIFKRKLLEALK